MTRAKWTRIKKKLCIWIKTNYTAVSNPIDWPYQHDISVHFSPLSVYSPPLSPSNSLSIAYTSSLLSNHHLIVCCVHLIIILVHITFTYLYYMLYILCTRSGTFHRYKILLYVIILLSIYWRMHIYTHIYIYNISHKALFICSCTVKFLHSLSIFYFLTSDNRRYQWISFAVVLM